MSVESKEKLDDLPGKEDREAQAHDDDHVHSSHNNSGVHRPEIDTSGVDERKLMRKIDWHVVPWLGVLYLLNFLDRGNIGNARVCPQA